MKEPSWHRNQRKQRQQDRGLLYAQKLGLVQRSAATIEAALRLANHHGSLPVRMPDAMPGGWKCKHCKDRSGAAFVNRATRDSCMLCRIHKGKSYGGESQDSKASPTKSLAQRQEEQRKAADKKLQKEQGQHRLQKENERLKAEIDKLKGTNGDKAHSEKPEDHSELKELERQRGLYSKLPGQDQKVKELDQQIQALRGGKVAAHPAGQQLRRAEQALAKKKKKRQAIEEDVANLQAQLAARQDELASIASDEKAAEEELEKIKRSITQEVTRGPTLWAGMAEGCGEWLKMLPKDILLQQGLSEDSFATFNTLCQKFAACSEAARASRAAEEEATRQQAEKKSATNTAGSGDVQMGAADAAHSGDTVDATGEPVPKAVRTEKDDIESLCRSSNPEEMAAGLKCKELLDARASKRAGPY